MTNPDYTHLLLIVDCSGSMYSLAGDMNGAIDTLLTEQAALPGKILVDVVTFSDTVRKAATSAQPGDLVGRGFVRPSGSTALNDAIGLSVTDLGTGLSLLEDDLRPGKVIVAIITDGYENASREWTTQSVKDLVTQQTEQWAWDFLFLGANIDSFATGAGYGVSQTMDYAATSAGAGAVGQSVSSYVTRARTTGDGGTLGEA